MSHLKHYKGVIKKLGQRCAFIDHTSVTKMDGSPSGLETQHDIFIHQENFSFGSFKIGQELSFGVADDTRRNKTKKGALKCVEVTLYGLKLHFPEQVVDHPTVPISWTIDAELLVHMKKTVVNDGTICLVVGAISGEDGRAKVLEYIIGLEAIEAGRSFISFRRPGVHQVFVYLVCYADKEDRVKKALKEVNINRFSPVSFDGDLQTNRTWLLPFTYDESGGGGVGGDVLSIDVLSLEVPDGIFAKPMPAWAKPMCRYYGIQEAEDDCDRRGKQWLANTVGIPVMLAWELFNRALMALFGLGSLLYGVDPRPLFKEAFTSELESEWSALSGVFVRDLMDFSGWKVIFRPIVPLGIWAQYEAFGSLIKMYAIHVSGYINPIVTLVVLLVLAYLYKKSSIGKPLAERKAEKAKHAEHTWQQFEKKVQGSADGITKPAPFRLIASEVIRKVCRPAKRS